MAKMRLLNERTQAEQEVRSHYIPIIPLLTLPFRHETPTPKPTNPKSPPNVNAPSRNANAAKPKPKRNQNEHKPFNPPLTNSANNSVSESLNCWNRRAGWTRRRDVRTMRGIRIEALEIGMPGHTNGMGERDTEGTGIGAGIWARGVGTRVDGSYMIVPRMGRGGTGRNRGDIKGDLGGEIIVDEEGDRRDRRRVVDDRLGALRRLVRSRRNRPRCLIRRMLVLFRL